MQIAVVSHKGTETGGHAGRARRFLLYTIEDRAVVRREDIQLEAGQSFHDLGHGLPRALSGIQALIAGSAGPGLVRKLQEAGVDAVLTEEPDADHAVELWLAERLERLDPATLQHGQHGHDHGHDHGHAGGGCH